MGSSKYACEVDMWSLGVLIYEMLAGNPPWKHENENVLYHNI